jgi:hypothetical protein
MSDQDLLLKHAWPRLHKGMAAGTMSPATALSEIEAHYHPAKPVGADAECAEYLRHLAGGLDKKGHVHKTLGEHLVSGGLVLPDERGISQARLRHEMGIPDPVPDQKTAERREVEGQVRAAQRANERAQSYRRGEVKDVNGNRISIAQHIDGASNQAIDGTYGGSYAPPIRDAGSVGGGALAAIVADNSKTKMASMLGPRGPVPPPGARGSEGASLGRGARVTAAPDVLMAWMLVHLLERARGALRGLWTLMMQSLEMLGLKARIKAALARPTVSAFRKLYGEEKHFLDFCRLLEIRVKKAGGTGTERNVRFNPTKIQLAYCALRTQRDVILKPRQVRITTIELARDVWFWLTKRGVNVRIVCQSSSKDDMVSELSGRVKLMLDSLRRNAGLQLDLGNGLSQESNDSWVLEDGGGTLKIIGAGASEKAANKKGRGPTIHRLHTTEIAFWEFAGATLSAIRGAIPKIEEGSEVVHESTPNGAAGENRDGEANASGGPIFYWLYQDAKQKKTKFQAVFFCWLDEPEYQLPLEPGEVVTPDSQPDRAKAERERHVVSLGATPEQLKWYRAQVAELGQAKTDQEFPSDDITCFLVGGRKFFDTGMIDSMIAAARAPNAPTPLEKHDIRRPGAIGQLRIWARARYGFRYVISGDTAEGTGGDGSGGHVYETSTGRHMATLSGQFKPDELAKDLAKLGERFVDERVRQPALIAVERNNHGHACLAALVALGYPSIYADKDGKDGWYSVEGKRTTALDELERAVRQGEWVSPDLEVLGEMSTFVVNKDGRAEADKGSHDDHVIMAMIGWNVIGKSVPIPILPPRAQGPSGGGRKPGATRFGSERGFG